MVEHLAVLEVYRWKLLKHYMSIWSLIRSNCSTGGRRGREDGQQRHAAGWEGELEITFEMDYYGEGCELVKAVIFFRETCESS
jgi:hypothetical protein